MSALTTRKEARERLLKLFEQSLDRIIPPQEMTPLKGQTFRDFEEQVEAVRKTILPAILEERAALEPTARVEDAGHCPHCRSDRVYLEKGPRKAEVIGPHGPVMMELQRARCRCCGRSFSPSGAVIGPAGGGSADAARGRASGTGSGDPAV
jgi:predicted Zn-ribbon and HTH transcriptional regulator